MSYKIFMNKYPNCELYVYDHVNIIKFLDHDIRINSYLPFDQLMEEFDKVYSTIDLVAEYLYKQKFRKRGEFFCIKSKLYVQIRDNHYFVSFNRLNMKLSGEEIMKIDFINTTIEEIFAREFFISV